MFSELKRELRQRDAAGWAKVKWELPQPPALNEMEVVHGRLIYLNPKVGYTSGFVFQWYMKRGHCMRCDVHFAPGLVASVISGRLLLPGVNHSPENSVRQGRCVANCRTTPAPLRS